MPYLGNVLNSFAVETGNINDQAITSPKLSATGGTDGQVLELDSNGSLVWSSVLEVDTVSVAGTTTTNRLIVDDDGSGSPIAVIKTDDGNPYAFCVKNDTYSTTLNVGFLGFQENDGDIFLETKGDAEYVQFNLRQNNGTTARALIYGAPDGTVNLYHAGNNKLYTTSSGITVTGSVTCNAASPQLVLQDNDNTGVGAVGSIVSQDSGGSSKWLVGDFSTANENLYLYNYATADLILSVNNGGKQITFTSAGHFVPADDDAQDLGTSTTEWRNAYFDGVVNCDQLDVDGTIDIAGNASFFGNVDLQDSDFLRLGSGNDLKLHHNGTNSWIENETGSLFIDQKTNDNDIFLRSDNGTGGLANYINCDGSTGEVKLYHYGTEKFATQSTGIQVAGTQKIINSVDSGDSPASSASIFLSNRNTSLDGELAGGIFMDCYRDVSNPSYAGAIWFLRNQYSGNASSSTDIVFGAQGNAGTGLPNERARITADGDFRFNSGYGSSATAYGCRAWVNFTGSGTVTIKADGNVTSITDNGTGIYTVNFTNNMPDANYAYTLGARDIDNGMGVPTLQADPTATPSTSALKLIYNYPHNQSYYDAADVCVAVFR